MSLRAKQEQTCARVMSDPIAGLKRNIPVRFLQSISEPIGSNLKDPASCWLFPGA
jgi:hypothetical protein